MRRASHRGATASSARRNTLSRESLCSRLAFGTGVKTHFGGSAHPNLSLQGAPFGGTEPSTCREHRLGMFGAGAAIRIETLTWFERKQAR